MGVFHVPGVFVGHPLSISEQRTHGRTLAFDGRFVTAYRLEGEDVLGSEIVLLWSEWGHALRNRWSVDIQEFGLFFVTRRFGEGRTGFVRKERSSSIIEVLLVETNELDLIGVGERFDEGTSCIVSSCFSVCYDTFHSMYKIRVSLDEVVANLFGIISARGSKVFQVILVDGRLPAIEKFEGSRKASTMLF